MRKSVSIFLCFEIVLIGLWLLADSLYLSPFDQQKFGTSFTQISGIVALSTMAFSTLLAVRPIWLEDVLGGLDKMYRLHKWQSIFAMIIAVAHWQLAASPNGHRGQLGNSATPQGADTAAQGWLSSLEGPAHGVAQPALWILLALVGIALIKKIPYHIFALTHRLVPAVFLVLVFHSLVLAKPGYWAQPVGWIFGLVSLIGSIAALIALFRQIGARRKVGATVVSKTFMPDVKSLLVELQMEEGWRGHIPGQFAFVSLRKSWKVHPFTIASSWNAISKRISFIVKELGDTTTALDARLTVGTALVVEGPYGRFVFQDTKKRQIWISAGIGITPFVARMKELSKSPGTHDVDLFHSDIHHESPAYELLREDARNGNVNLHLVVTPRDGRLTGEKIRATVPNWREASIWFCGPSRFAATLKLDLLRNGMNSSDFHHELFEMR